MGFWSYWFRQRGIYNQWSPDDLDSYGRLKGGCIGVVKFNLKKDVVLGDRSDSKCFYFPDPTTAWSTAKKYAETHKCPDGQHSRFFAVNYWKANNPFQSYDKGTGVVVINEPQTSPGGTYPFDFAYYDQSSDRWVGADHNHYGFAGLGPMTVIFWPDLTVFSDWYPTLFDTTVVCTACGP